MFPNRRVHLPLAGEGLAVHLLGTILAPYGPARKVPDVHRRKMVMASVYPTATEKLGFTEFLFPYDRTMVEDMKGVPVAFRSYDPDKRMWTISIPYASRILDLFLRRFPHATIHDKTRAHTNTAPPPPPPRPLHADPYEVLHFLPSAPPELIEAAARTLAKLHHPDLKPVHEKARATATMAKINRAAEDLRRQRGVA